MATLVPRETTLRDPNGTWSAKQDRRIAGFIAVPAGRRLPTRPGACGAGILGLVAVVAGTAVPGLGQAVVRLLHA